MSKQKTMTALIRVNTEAMTLISRIDAAKSQLQRNKNAGLSTDSLERDIASMETQLSEIERRLGV